MPFPFELTVAAVDCSLRSAEMRWTRAAGREWIDTTSRRRAEALVAYAREHSPFYRDRLRDLPPRAPLSALPVTTKRELMARFDEWATDRRVTREAANRHAADGTAIGQPFLGAYTLWSSSGTTGEPGLFVQDDDALSTYDALVLAQADARLWGPAEMGRWAASAGGTALIVAVGAPFPSIVAWQRLRRINPALRGRAYSITTPLAPLVAALNRDRPAVLATYPTMAVLLALEKLAGRLAIEPASVWCGGESLSPVAEAMIGQAFGCHVHNEYGAAECFAIGADCPQGSMHLNADWVVLEPVDSEYRPVPAGAPSFSVLLTNLANRLQPILRYDLGDSVTLSEETCACGSALPVIEVRGRSGDILSLRAPDGRLVRLVPLALETVIEESLGAAPFQIVAHGETELRLRLWSTPAAPLPATARGACRRALREYLAGQGLPNVKVIDDPGAPAIHECTGKLRRVLASPEA